MRRVEEDQFPRQYYEREPAPQARQQSRDYMRDYMRDDDYLYNEQPSFPSSASLSSSASSTGSASQSTSPTSSTSSSSATGEDYKKQAFEQRGKIYNYLALAQACCWCLIIFSVCLLAGNVFIFDFAFSAIDGLLIVIVLLEVAKAARLRVAQNDIIIDLLAKIADKK